MAKKNWAQFLGIYLEKQEQLKLLVKESKEKEVQYQEARKKTIEKMAELKIYGKELNGFIEKGEIASLQFVFSESGCAIIVDNQRAITLDKKDPAKDKNWLFSLADKLLKNEVAAEDLVFLEAMDIIKKNCPIVCLIGPASRNNVKLKKYSYFLKISAINNWRFAVTLFEDQ